MTHKTPQLTRLINYYQHDQSNPHLLLSLIERCYINGEAHLAHTFLEQLKRLLTTSQFSQACLHMSNIFHHREDLASAIDLLTFCRLDSAPVQGYLALLHFDAQDTPLATHHARLSLQQDPGNLHAQCVMTYLNINQCSPTNLSPFLEQYPKEGRLHHAHGLNLLMRLDLNAARCALTTACTLLPDFAGAWLSLAWCQLLQNKAALAEKSFKAARNIDRNFSEPHGGLALTALCQKNQVKAWRLIEIALKLDANSHLATLAKAIYYNDLSPQKAQATYIKAMTDMFDSRILGVMNSSNKSVTSPAQKAATSSLLTELLI